MEWIVIVLLIGANVFNVLHGIHVKKEAKEIELRALAYLHEARMIEDRTKKMLEKGGE